MTEKSETLENIKNLFSYIKVGKEVSTFGNTEIEKNNFCSHKTPIFLGDVDTEKHEYLTRFLLVKKNRSTLLVTCIMVTNLNH